MHVSKFFAPQTFTSIPTEVTVFLETVLLSLNVTACDWFKNM